MEMIQPFCASFSPSVKTNPPCKDRLINANYNYYLLAIIKVLKGFAFFCIFIRTPGLSLACCNGYPYVSVLLYRGDLAA